MKDEQTSSRAMAVPASRVGRMGRLGSMTAGIAGNMAVNGIAQLGRGQRPKMRDLLLTPTNITRVADQLAKMRGAAMKIGQLMSMDTGEVLPPELSQIMARLRDDAHFMPPAQLKQVLNAQWPKGWLGQFSKFDVRPIAAASIGQVHRAQLKDGRDVAIKVQYPGVAKSIDSDVANVGALMRMSGLLPKGFELAPYLEEARKQLHEETDYAREAEELVRFGALLQDMPQFTVPQFHADWSTPDILTMSFVSGTPIEEAVMLPAEIRNQIAHDLIDLTLAELFTFGAMQTDPNFANYQYSAETGQIVLLDFGAARSIDVGTADRYRALMRAGLLRETEALRQGAWDLGFIGEETRDAHTAQVVAMIDTVFATLKAAPVYDFTDLSLSQKMQAMGQALAEDGFIPPPVPIDVLLLQRKFGGMFLLANRLKAQVPVQALLEKYLGD
ncbi:MAG: AarF/ABC1/UbiB kinase family protein [Pseudomonadota bacterium]